MTTPPMERQADRHRRAFLRFLAASPLSGVFGAGNLAFGQSESGSVIDDPKLAIDVFDLKKTASELMPPAHYGYIATGTFGDKTLHANRSAFDKYYLRSRRLVDVSNIDTRVTLFGQEYSSPVLLCPIGSQKAFHPDGELASARAARRRNHLQVLSTVSSTAIEDVVAARGAPIWHQLYPTGSWDVARRIMRRAEAAGCPAVVLTVDLPAGASGRQSLTRAIRKDSRDCAVCHDNPDVARRAKPMYAGLDIPPAQSSQASLTWEFISRMRDATSMKILVKGIVTAEDAEQCVRYGVDGIVVSNHGGRADDSGRGAIESLEEVVAAVDGRAIVIMDSGIRRGTDIVKALALGADAVGVGRPYVWGLGAFGEAGVDRALELLQDELRAIMEFTGTPRIADITAGFIGRHE